MAIHLNLPKVGLDLASILPSLLGLGLAPGRDQDVKRQPIDS